MFFPVGKPFLWFITDNIQPADIQQMQELCTECPTFPVINNLFITLKYPTKKSPYFFKLYRKKQGDLNLYNFSDESEKSIIFLTQWLILQFGNHVC